MSKRQAAMEGFRPIRMNHRSFTHPRQPLPWPKNSLNWPVTSINKLDPVGNDTVQYQNYGKPYYHGGLDIVSPRAAMVYAPVTGILEGGYYSYTDNPDGSMTKHWKAWPKKGRRLYFELAVVTPQGYRFELHHVDPQGLLPETIKALDRGGVSVMAGAALGKVVPWPVSTYHHIHYNIVEPNGKIRVNGEWVSKARPDKVKPTVKAIYAVEGSSQGRAIQPGQKLSRDNKELVVQTLDYRTPGGYQHPPARVQIVNSRRQALAGWDFRARLISPRGTWPHIWNFYRPFLNTGRGRIKTWGDYGKGEYLVRLPLAKVLGEFYVEAEDMNGQITRIGPFYR